MSVCGERGLGGVLAVALLVLVGCSGPGSQVQVTPSNVGQSSLTASEQTLLAALEARPLAIPRMPADGNCPDGPQSKVAPFGANSASYLAATGGMLYGAGPVYAIGGPETDGAQYSFFDVTFFTDPTVHGIALFRGQQLDGRYKVVYAGPWATGSVVGTDKINGQTVTLHSELALPADRPTPKAGVASGWGDWEIRQGIDKRYNRCTGFQIDTAAGTEVFVAA
jgi:hypothetical protein